MSFDNGHLSSQGFSVSGALAEIISVLDQVPKNNSLLPSGIAIEQLLRALDTSSPPEERVDHASEILKRIRASRRLARWIPWYSALPQNEFLNEFYPAYRDHSIHTLHVYLLGLYLYETVERGVDPILSTS